MTNESITIDGSSSYDNYNLSNRNFNYSWSCPDTLNTICPSDQESEINLNSA